MLTDARGLHVQAGHIVDDEINAVLVNPLVTGMRLHAVIHADQNHSDQCKRFACAGRANLLAMRSMQFL